MHEHTQAVSDAWGTTTNLLDVQSGPERRDGRSDAIEIIEPTKDSQVHRTTLDEIPQWCQERRRYLVVSGWVSG
jgi:hypothetical protein